MSISLGPKTGVTFDRKAHSDKFALSIPDTPDDNRTIQSHRDSADLNLMLKKFGVTGVLSHNPRVPLSGDFSNVGDYKSAMNALVSAKNEFMKLPASIRARFQNDPQEYMQFCTATDKDGKLANLDELRKMGIAKPAPVPVPEPPPQKVEIVNPVPPKKD